MAAQLFSSSVPFSYVFLKFSLSSPLVRIFSIPIFRNEIFNLETSCALAVDDAQWKIPYSADSHGSRVPDLAAQAPNVGRERSHRNFARRVKVNEYARQCSSFVRACVSWTSQAASKTLARSARFKRLVFSAVSSRRVRPVWGHQREQTETQVLAS